MTQSSLNIQTQIFCKSFFRYLNTIFKKIESARLASAVELVKQEMMKNKEYHKTVKELTALSDRELGDIGITRGEIHSVAMEVYLDAK